MTSRSSATTQAEDALSLMSIMQRFSTEEAARDYFENLRWPNGPVCPHCGNSDSARVYKVTPNAAKKIRAGLYKCAECGDQFTVTVGTVMEDSHIPLNKWLVAFYIMCASRLQVSALQLQRQLKIGSYRSALFLCHRIRFALMDVAPSSKLGGSVEADETYIGGMENGRGRARVGNKTNVVSLVDRDSRVRSQVVEKVTGKEITKILKSHIALEAHLNTGEYRLYKTAGKEFASHDVVNHSAEEHARLDVENRRLAATNAVEGFLGNSKHSLDGTHHHISKKHTGLYFSELDYKYNTRARTDGLRTVAGIKGMAGKRMVLRAAKLKVT